VKRLPLILAGLAVLAVLVYSAVFIVNEREQAIVLRFGEIRRVITEPGLYFKVPTNFVETVQIIEDRLISFDIENLRVQVRDGRRYLVDAFVVFKISDPRKFRENVTGSLTQAQENLRTRLDASLRRVYGLRSFEAALSEQRAAMMLEVRDQLRPLALELGINIVDVRIRRTDLLPEVSQETFNRMKAERLAEAAELRAFLPGDLQPDEGGTVGGSGGIACLWHAGIAAHPGRGRSRGGGDGCRGQPGFRNPARPGRCGTEPCLCRGVPA
jgi:membrane protease subunit HflC